MYTRIVGLICGLHATTTFGSSVDSKELKLKNIDLHWWALSLEDFLKGGEIPKVYAEDLTYIGGLVNDGTLNKDEFGAMKRIWDLNPPKKNGKGDPPGEGQTIFEQYLATVDGGKNTNQVRKNVCIGYLISETGVAPKYAALVCENKDNHFELIMPVITALFNNGLVESEAKVSDLVTVLVGADHIKRINADGQELVLKFMEGNEVKLGPNTLAALNAYKGFKDFIAAAASQPTEEQDENDVDEDDVEVSKFLSKYPSVGTGRFTEFAVDVIGSNQEAPVSLENLEYVFRHTCAGYLYQKHGIQLEDAESICVGEQKEYAEVRFAVHKAFDTNSLLELELSELIKNCNLKIVADNPAVTVIHMLPDDKQEGPVHETPASLSEYWEQQPEDNKSKIPLILWALYWDLLSGNTDGTTDKPHEGDEDEDEEEGTGDDEEEHNDEDETNGAFSIGDDFSEFAAIELSVAAEGMDENTVFVQVCEGFLFAGVGVSFVDSTAVCSNKGSVYKEVLAVVVSMINGEKGIDASAARLAIQEHNKGLGSEGQDKQPSYIALDEKTDQERDTEIQNIVDKPGDSEEKKKIAQSVARWKAFVEYGEKKAAAEEETVGGGSGSAPSGESEEDQKGDKDVGTKDDESPPSQEITLAVTDDNVECVVLLMWLKLTSESIDKICQLKEDNDITKKISEFKLPFLVRDNGNTMVKSIVELLELLKGEDRTDDMRPMPKHHKAVNFQDRLERGMKLRIIDQLVDTAIEEHLGHAKFLNKYMKDFHKRQPRLMEELLEREYYRNLDSVHTKLYHSYLHTCFGLLLSEGIVGPDTLGVSICSGPKEDTDALLKVTMDSVHTVLSAQVSERAVRDMQQLLKALVDPDLKRLPEEETIDQFISKGGKDNKFSTSLTLWRAYEGEVKKGWVVVPSETAKPTNTGGKPGTKPHPLKPHILISGKKDKKPGNPVNTGKKPRFLNLLRQGTKKTIDPKETEKEDKTKQTADDPSTESGSKPKAPVGEKDTTTDKGITTTSTDKTKNSPEGDEPVISAAKTEETTTKELPPSTNPRPDVDKNKSKKTCKILLYWLGVVDVTAVCDSTEEQYETIWAAIAEIMKIDYTKDQGEFVNRLDVLVATIREAKHKINRSHRDAQNVPDGIDAAKSNLLKFLNENKDMITKYIFEKARQLVKDEEVFKSWFDLRHPILKQRIQQHSNYLLDSQWIATLVKGIYTGTCYGLLFNHRIVPYSNDDTVTGQICRNTSTDAEIMPIAAAIHTLLRISEKAARDVALLPLSATLKAAENKFEWLAKGESIQHYVDKQEGKRVGLLNNYNELWNSFLTIGSPTK